MSNSTGSITHDGITPCSCRSRGATVTHLPGCEHFTGLSIHDQYETEDGASVVIDELVEALGHALTCRLDVNALMCGDCRKHVHLFNYALRTVAP